MLTTNWLAGLAVKLLPLVLGHEFLSLPGDVLKLEAALWAQGFSLPLTHVAEKPPANRCVHRSLAVGAAWRPRQLRHFSIK